MGVGAAAAAAAGRTAEASGGLPVRVNSKVVSPIRTDISAQSDASNEDTSTLISSGVRAMTNLSARDSWQEFRNQYKDPMFKAD
jgi:hypothetical protein